MLKFVPMLLLLTLSACVPITPESQQSDVQRADIHYKLAQANLRSGNPSGALKELFISVELDPDNAAIQVALAQTYQRKEAYQQAEKHYLKALKISDNDPRYQNNLASLYLDLEQWDKAIYYFDLAAHNLLFVDTPVSIAGIGYAYLKKNDFQTALGYLNESIELAPRYASPYFFKSKIYHSLGNKVKEKLSLQRAIRIEPKFLEPRYQLALLLVQEGSIAEAIEHLEAIIEYSPNTTMSFKAEDLLQKLSGTCY
ncbi:MAG: tetratricopeptide repeat protein [Desulfuromusa sp.]|nr:tetratricopeptide repeat protein [Desulfuromusa sp.]